MSIVCVRSVHIAPGLIQFHELWSCHGSLYGSRTWKQSKKASKNPLYHGYGHVMHHNTLKQEETLSKPPRQTTAYQSEQQP